MGLPDGPCCGCEDRVVGCHAQCLRYKEWNRKHHEYKTTVYNNRAKEKFYARYVRDRNAKHMREM